MRAAAQRWFSALSSGLTVHRRPRGRTGDWCRAGSLCWQVPGWSSAIPYVAVGPPDFEEYFTGVVTTQVAMKAIVHGAWPFWSLDFGLGMPQPLRFHFIQHPLAPLCLVWDCQAVLRLIAVVHLLIGAIFMTLLGRRLTSSWVLGWAAGLTYCLCSSVVQPMVIDDWPLTAMHESERGPSSFAIAAYGR